MVSSSIVGLSTGKRGMGSKDRFYRPHFSPRYWSSLRSWQIDVNSQIFKFSLQILNFHCNRWVSLNTLFKEWWTFITVWIFGPSFFLFTQGFDVVTNRWLLLIFSLYFFSRLDREVPLSSIDLFETGFESETFFQLVVLIYLRAPFSVNDRVQI